MYQVDGLVACLEVKELFATFADCLLKDWQGDHQCRGVVVDEFLYTLGEGMFDVSGHALYSGEVLG